MTKLVKWLEKIELKAAELYQCASEAIEEDEEFSVFAARLARDERQHASHLGSVSKNLLGQLEEKSAVEVDEKTKREVERYLIDMEAQIKKLPASKNALIETILDAESSEWNDIFLHVVSSFKEKERTFQRLASDVTKHRREIERFAEKAGIEGHALTQLKGKPALWKSNILIIENEAPVRDILDVILKRIGTTTIAENGREALGKIEKEHFDLIFSDIDMPIMDGMKFYLEAARFDPEIGERMIYFSGQLDSETRAFLMKNKLKFITKPSSMMEIREAAEAILKRVPKG